MLDRVGLFRVERLLPRFGSTSSAARPAISFSGSRSSEARHGVERGLLGRCRTRSSVALAPFGFWVTAVPFVEVADRATVPSIGSRVGPAGLLVAARSPPDDELVLAGRTGWWPPLAWRLGAPLLGVGQVPVRPTSMPSPVSRLGVTRQPDQLRISSVCGKDETSPRSCRSFRRDPAPMPTNGGALPYPLVPLRQWRASGPIRRSCRVRNTNRGSMRRTSPCRARPFGSWRPRGPAWGHTRSAAAIVPSRQALAGLREVDEGVLE